MLHREPKITANEMNMVEMTSNVDKDLDHHRDTLCSKEPTHALSSVVKLGRN